MMTLNRFGLPSCQLPVAPSSIYSEGWDLPLEYYWDESCDLEVMRNETPKGLLKKFDGLPPIPGFSSNCLVVFNDEKILGEEDRGGLPFDKIRPMLVHKEQFQFGREVCRYLKDNKVRDIHLVPNITDVVDETNDVEVPEVLPSSSSSESKSDRLLEPNSTEVTVILLYCSKKLLKGKNFQKEMGTVLRNAIEASRSGVIVLTTVSLLPLNKLADTPLSELLSELVKKEDEQLEKYQADLPTPGPKNYLEISCSRHNTFSRTIYNSWDLEEASPFGGCHESSCGDGHLVVRECKEGHSTIRNRSDERCHQEVTATLCFHEAFRTTQMRCYQRDMLYCHVPVSKPLPCGHSALLPCSFIVTGDYQCQEKVTQLLPCGHEGVLACSNKSIDKYKCYSVHWVVAKCGQHKIRKFCKDLFPLQTTEVEWECSMTCEKMCPRGLGGHPCKKRHACYDPCPPCLARIQWTLPCKHKLMRKCWQPDAMPSDCKTTCNKLIESCFYRRHYCTKRCPDKCPTVCEEKMPIYCRRGHSRLVPCFEAEAQSKETCQDLTPAARQPPCGHVVNVPCALAKTMVVEEVQKYCVEECQHVFLGERECGHKCRGNCTNCFQGRLHQRCSEPCGRALICGHYCETPCSMICPPCSRPCYNKCEHWECELECGVPCSLDCQEPCSYRCEHSSCSNLCSEVCNKTICTEPCKLLIKCGHPCIGFCGEICPPYCFECTPEKIDDDPLFLRGKEPRAPTTRFLFLPDCGHCVDSYTMDEWMAREDAIEDEIKAKHCPLCPSRITSFKRYSSVMNFNRKVIDSIRQKMFGDKEEIKRSMASTKEIVSGYIENETAIAPPAKDVQRFGNYFVNLLQDDEKSLFLAKAKFIFWISQEWVTVSEGIHQFTEALPAHLLKRFVDYWSQLFGIVLGRDWPLHPNEIEDFRGERRRVDDAISLYKLLIQNQHSLRLATNKEGKKHLVKVEDILFKPKRYDAQLKTPFKETLKELESILHCTLKITDKERREVVAAFGGKAGRWFKCKNGHIYVITECGGATEIGKCSECGVVIGGEHHLLAPENYLATEMDGAEEPAWPSRD